MGGGSFLPMRSNMKYSGVMMRKPQLAAIQKTILANFKTASRRWTEKVAQEAGPKRNEMAMPNGQGTSEAAGFSVREFEKTGLPKRLRPKFSRGSVDAVDTKADQLIDGEVLHASGLQSRGMKNLTIDQL